MNNNQSVVHDWDGVAMPTRLWAIFAVTFGVALAVIDGVIVNVALPTITESLCVTPSQSIWIVNSYQISIVVSLLILSGLGDFLGYRRVYLSGVALFTLASIGCAIAPSLDILILSRVVQGLGASAIMSINASIIRLIYPRRMLGRGLGINSTVVSVSSVVGPTIAAVILAMGSWHWLFLVNVPIGILALVLGLLYIPHNPKRLESLPFSMRGAVLNILFFGLFFAIVSIFSTEINYLLLSVVVVLFGFIGWLFVTSQLKSAKPILPFDLMRIPIFSMSVLTSSLSFVAQMSTMVAVPFLMQQRMGATPVEIGLVVTAWPLVNMITAVAAGFLVERVHAGILGGVGLTIFSFGLLMFLVLPNDLSNIDIIWRLILCGFGFGLFQSPNNSVIIASAPIERSGSASGVMAMARMVGQTLGAVMVAVYFNIFPQSDTSVIMVIAGVIAVIATIISFSRLSLPLPEALVQRAKK